MGFNLMSFLGGAASAGTRGIEQRKAQRAKEKETAEARQWQIATEARADARARKARRSSDRKALEEQIGTMVALGMDPEAARAVAKNGKGAMKVAIGDLEYGRENGINAASYYTMGQKGLLQDDPSKAIKAAEPAGLSIDSEGIRNMYGPVDKEYTSHNEQIRAITNKQLKLTAEDPAYVTLENQRQALYADIGAIAKAKDTSGEDDGRKFTEGTVRAQISQARADALSKYEISMNIETQVRTGLQGKGLEVNLADLHAAKFLRGGAGKVGDPFMNDSIVQMEKDATEKLQSQAFSALRDDSQNANNTVKNITKQEYNQARQTLEEGNIIRVPTEDNEGRPTGRFSILMYTGVPNQIDPELIGEPYIFLTQG